MQKVLDLNQPFQLVVKTKHKKICQLNNIQSTEGRSKTSSQCILTTPQAKDRAQHTVISVYGSTTDSNLYKEAFFLQSCIHDRVKSQYRKCELLTEYVFIHT
jgi:hypothetical protein